MSSVDLEQEARLDEHEERLEEIEAALDSVLDGNTLAKPGEGVPMTALDTVAFDIKPPGFATTDQLTVVGFDAEISSRVFLNVDERTPPDTSKTAQQPTTAASDPLNAR
ncbi:hypothetical protein [Haloarcula amylovorans]|uniref:hypothetical protein n=1 Tax=Haloarcula amylovorans TaxID=2562280 RepID=UPI001ADDB403|nr:hypothetical protein [Halomicroarcula amylolytica]